MPARFAGFRTSTKQDISFVTKGKAGRDYVIQEERSENITLKRVILYVSTMQARILPPPQTLRACFTQQESATASGFGHAQLKYIHIFYTFQQQYPNYLNIFTFAKEAKSCNKLRIVFNMWPWTTKPVIRVHFSKLRFIHHVTAE